MSKILFKTTLGDFTVQLHTEQAPVTCANFIEYVEQGFFDHTIFHRVINDFMIQGGGFTEDMQQKSTQATIKNEANNGLSNKVGTLAMARTADPHSATAQFFINVSDNHFLDFTSETSQGWGYAVFGEVISGMEVINQIKTVQTGNQSGHQDVPVEPIIMTKVSQA